MPDPEKLESAPPETAMSDSMKSLDVSESVNVSTAVSPAFKEVTSELMATVGLTVSTVRVTLLSESEPSLLAVPAALVNFADATEITPLVVLFAVGVNVAV